jgi:hypothetical protein
VKWLVLVLGCAAAPVPAKAVPVDPDAEACKRLCAREAACGADTKDCATSCSADTHRMKPGFIARYSTCFVAELDKACHKLDDKAREAAHLRCFDATLAFFPRDEKNQRDMAEAVCNRGERCMGLGKLGRDACMQATLDPQEAEVKLGQRLVDALRPARVQAFRACVDGAPCAKLETHDDAVDQCYARTIAGAT